MVNRAPPFFFFFFFAQRSSTPAAQRARQIDRNKQVVQELDKYLPAQRDALTPGEAIRAECRAERRTTVVPLQFFSHPHS